MMRAAMPKPKRRNTAQAAAAAHKGRPRHLPTAHALRQAVSDEHDRLSNFASRCQRHVSGIIHAWLVAAGHASEAQADWYAGAYGPGHAATGEKRGRLRTGTCHAMNHNRSSAPACSSQRMHSINLSFSLGVLLNVNSSSVRIVCSLNAGARADGGATPAAAAGAGQRPQATGTTGCCGSLGAYQQHNHGCRHCLLILLTTTRPHCCATRG